MIEKMWQANKDQGFLKSDLLEEKKLWQQRLAVGFLEITCLPSSTACVALRSPTFENQIIGLILSLPTLRNPN